MDSQSGVFPSKEKTKHIGDLGVKIISIEANQITASEEKTKSIADSDVKIDGMKEDLDVKNDDMKEKVIADSEEATECIF